jgi:hypothetical protein
MGEKQDKDICHRQGNSCLNHCAAAQAFFIIDGCFSAIAVLLYAVTTVQRHTVTMAQRHDGTTLQFMAA